MLFRRPIVLTLSLLVAAAPLTVSGGASARLATASAGGASTGSTGSQVVLDWEATLIRTVYTENAAPIPSGVLYLGFTSVAMYDAMRTAHRIGHSSPVAAIARAAHDVLAEYFPASAANLATDLDASLATVPDGAYQNRGEQVGARVAARLIEARADDGRDDSSIVYARDDAPGVWQPPEGGAMAVAWLGRVDPLVLEHRVRVNGPDPITSAAYAFDYQEVKRVGGAGPTADRTDHQAQTATFFTPNLPFMMQESVLGLLAAAPMSLRSTARTFAQMHAAMSDAIITCWRLKYDVGFWRPFQAINGAAGDGNPATVAEPGWAPLVPNPPYSDYVSGHGCLTAPAVEVIRRTVGEETSLTFHSTATGAGPERTYPTLSELEFDAFHARIWGGLHFRDAMEDAYDIGHETARRVMSRIR